VVAMAGAARGVVSRVVASALGLVVAAAVFTVVAHAVGGHLDSSHRLRAVMPAAAAASVTTPVLPSRLPDLAGAPIPPASQPEPTGRLGIDTRPVVAPLPPQLRPGHADRGPPALAPTS
jgi:hypothetical protein